MLLALHRQATRSHRPSMAMPLAAALYRASGLVPWHETDMPKWSLYVRSWGRSGHLAARPRRPSLTRSGTFGGPVHRTLFLPHRHRTDRFGGARIDAVAWLRGSERTGDGARLLLAQL